MYRVGIVIGCFWSVSALSDAAPWTQDAGVSYLRSSVAYESLQTEDLWRGELRVIGRAQGKLRGQDFYLFLDAAQLRYEDGCRRDRVELGVGTHAGGRYHISQQFWYETGNLTATSFKV